MKVSAKINSFRRQLMNSLTKNIGNSYPSAHLNSGVLPEINRVLISRPNHRLGNQLLTTPLVQEIIDTFPNCKIDLFVKGGVANAVLENYDNIDKVIQLPKKPFSHLITYIMKWFALKKRSYDLVINGDKESSSGKLATKLAKGKFKLYGDLNEAIQHKFDDYGHIAKYPVYNLREFLSLIGFPKNHKAIPTLNIKLSDQELAKGKTVLAELVKNDKPTICIYTNATGVKCYDEVWWTQLYNQLLKDFPEYNVVELLPIENISRINFAAPNIYSKNIREMCALIANTAIFISADNGVMHLASAAQIPVVGFFNITNFEMKITNLEKYGPYGNKSVAYNTSQSNLNDWLKGIHKILS